ncbi:helix-turn-helix domain-containing protein [Asticcacaulis sp. YBE204]|uniref:helix-turn-helix domain-containing protein n=1 Tax=Asticcacaulis sp. YBE204 TaxID=1282363 RepID=UPI0003C401F8|nr:helix-turn-helix domain-containing protein [Asticcacaulis sp. YBE204]ESQ79171.1 Cro/Cl family transcriptional regulator [Asticcacaulis sp. YBE204]
MNALNINASASNDKTPNPIDIHVGGRVRVRRKFLGYSQEYLAEQIGLTFQQVQKYERGSNRISASKLFDIAKVLKVSVPYFFENLSDENSDDFAESHTERNVSHFLMTSEGIELAEAFPRIKSAVQRRKILELVRSLSDEL